MSKKIIITEAQLNKTVNILSEDRGMFTNYEKIVNPIIKYVETYIKNNQPNAKENLNNIEANVYNISIPINLLSEITWAENKIITINVFDITEQGLNSIGGIKWAKNFTSGSAYVLESDKLTPDNKLESLNVEFDLISVNKVLIANFIRNALYHELTHAFQNYNQLLKTGKGLYHSNLNTNYGEIKGNLESPSNDEYINMFNKINYTLLNTAELNATIAGVYGSLETLNSTRDNFAKDIQKISAYNMYKDIKDNYLPKLSALDDSYWDLFQNTTYLQKKNPTPGNQSGLRRETPQKFKQRFLNSVNFKLKQFINGIGKVASQYYDNVEK